MTAGDYHDPVSFVIHGGYAFFLSLSCIFGLVVAYLVDRGFEGWGFCVLLGNGLQAVFVYLAIRVSVNIRLDEVEKGVIALIVIYYIFLGIPLLPFFVYNDAHQSTSDRRKALRLAGFNFISYMIAIPGLVLLTVYCKQAKDIMGSDSIYLGPMRIIGTGFSSDYICHNDGCSAGGHWEYDGHVSVGFGGEWACPNQPDKWCEANVQNQRCYAQGSSSDAESCIFDLYHLDDWAVSFSELEFVLEESPESDESWPFDTFYGDCYSCTAITPYEFSTRAAFLDRIRLAGITFCSTAGVIFLAMLLGWFIFPDKVSLE